MNAPALSALRPHLRSRHDLLVDGATARAIDDRVATGGLQRIRRNAYVDGSVWRALSTEARHTLHIAAVSREAASDLVFSHVSAAVLHGLPLYRVQPRRVHVLVGAADRSSRRDVFRHEGEVPDDDVIEVDGVRCTSLERTVLDMARVAAPEVSLSCADAALGIVGGHPRRFDDAAAEVWREGMRRRCEMPGARGIRRARVIVDIADGRAELPLESVTRLQLRRLGFSRLRLQSPVPAPGGGCYWMDLELEEVDAFIECDGRGEYTEPAMRRGRTPEQVVLDEKRREDWVRGVTGRRVLRVSSSAIASTESLRRLLLAFHIPLPRRTHLELPTPPLESGI
ncbi:hypothetical protein [Microbacterium radiodurans]|uniref:Type IV toxin-antitoxin system AbiEi family antitoxin domain-containing protein n=1 Tax=Microbacterium radiodurans TaxID=661398 RepID=A0A5J5IVC2_9MICO|nr:hypothetical protein [Microbacterium radiodurans]KAA9089888.1 hypothetical protein F6B42_05455 [Microbacterium radiodurans]